MNEEKFAAYNGNLHCAIRVTPFFDSRAEAIEAARERNELSSWVRPCANWQEHMRWNTARVGNYADCPVAE